jgi:hypothetical protein
MPDTAFRSHLGVIKRINLTVTPNASQLRITAPALPSSYGSATQPRMVMIERISAQLRREVLYQQPPMTTMGPSLNPNP